MLIYFATFTGILQKSGLTEWLEEGKCQLNLRLHRVCYISKLLFTVTYNQFIPNTCGVTVETSIVQYKGDGLLARYVKLRVAHVPGMPGTFSPTAWISDSGMYHSTCVTHVRWCMPGSLTSGFLWSQWRGKTFPAFPEHAQPAILRIW